MSLRSSLRFVVVVLPFCTVVADFWSGASARVGAMEPLGRWSRSLEVAEAQKWPWFGHELME